MMPGIARALVMAALLGVIVPAPQGSPPPAPGDVSEVVGQGLWDKALCLGCAAVIVGGGELTWGGILLLASLRPDVIGACAYQCYRAFAT